MNLEDLQSIALKVKESYAQLKQKNNDPQWTSMDYTASFVGDVGDLIKLVMAKNNLRYIEDLDHKLEHELSDCLWSILIIAKEFNIDLEKVFVNNIEQLNNKLQDKLKV